MDWDLYHQQSACILQDLLMWWDQVNTQADEMCAQLSEVLYATAAELVHSKPWIDKNIAEHWATACLQ